MEPSALTDTRLIDVLNGAVAFVREAGIVGMLIAFIGALYTRRLVPGSEYEKLEQVNEEQAATIDRLTRILERSTDGFERVARRRVSEVEGYHDEDVALPPAHRPRTGRPRSE